MCSLNALSKLMAKFNHSVNFMKPRSINIFLLDGDPNGIRVAQISMSTIQAIAFRRNQLRRVREAFPEIERPGVYILIGADEDAQDRQLAYIGESEGVGARLSYHNSNEAGRDAKGFWTDTVVLISKDENLTKSHARYVEACLIRGVVSNPRWTLRWRSGVRFETPRVSSASYAGPTKVELLDQPFVLPCLSFLLSQPNRLQRINDPQCQSRQSSFIRWSRLLIPPHKPMPFKILRRAGREPANAAASNEGPGRDASTKSDCVMPFVWPSTAILGFRPPQAPGLFRNWNCPPVNS